MNFFLSPTNDRMFSKERHFYLVAFFPALSIACYEFKNFISNKNNTILHKDKLQ